MALKPQARSTKKDSGSYILLIKVSSPAIVMAGALGKLRFEPGWYAYCGNAKNGVKARVTRHLKKSGKKFHWHIDHFLAHRYVKVENVWGLFDVRFDECALVKKLIKTAGAVVTHNGFGASDCKSGCGAHLVKLPCPFGPKISSLPLVSLYK